jgi:DNA-binding Lrp family transcriptional regulator
MSIEKRQSVIFLHESSMKTSSIAKKLKMPLRTVQEAIKRQRETGTTKDRPRSGRPKSACIPGTIRQIREKIRRNPRRSMRKMAKEHKISEGSVRNIVKKKLRLKSIKLQKAHLLTTKNKADRITKSKAMLARLGNGTHLNVLWTDEKIFTTEQALNKQNDRILASSVAAASGRIVQRTAHPASVMVWGGITSKAKTPLVFVEMGAKVNQVYYREKILDTVVKPWFQRNFLDQEGIFQQDGAPAHTAKKT